MEPHTQNSNRQAGGLIAVTDNGRRAYEDYVVVTQARGARERSERERARMLSRAFGEKRDHTQQDGW
jgi:hypothetical protein